MSIATNNPGSLHAQLLLTPHQGQPVPHAPQHPQHVVPGGPLAAAGEPRTEDPTAFEQRANAHAMRPQRHAKALQKELKREAAQRQRTQRRQTRPSAAPEEDDETHRPLRSAGEHLLDSMLSGDSEREREHEERLEREYDPLQRFVLYNKARRQVDGRDLPDHEKDGLKERIDHKMQDLISHHRDEIRSGLRTRQDMDTAIKGMAGPTDANARVASLQELRHLYGAKGKGNFDSPLTPLAMAKALQREFGAEEFESGMSQLRNKMARELRVSQRPRTGPRLWLSMADAQCFNTVQSCFAIGSELNRNLARAPNVVPTGSHADTAMTLLGLPEAGRIKASNLTSQIADLRQADPHARLRSYQTTRESVSQLPITMWPPDKAAARLELLDDFSKLTAGASRELPSLPYSLRKEEHQWRDLLQQAQAGKAAK